MSRVHPEGMGDTVPAANPFSSPEQFRGEPVSASVDFWALGVLIHYMLKGHYLNYTTFKEGQFELQGGSQQLVDFVNNLLLMRPEKRLGSTGIMALKYHSFFEDFKWKQYQQMSLPSPIRAAMTDLKHPYKNLSREYNQSNSQSTFYDNYYSSQSLGSILFMDFATMIILDKIFEGGYVQQENIDPEANYDVLENQMATEIDLGGDLDFGDD